MAWVIGEAKEGAPGWHIPFHQRIRKVMKVEMEVTCCNMSWSTEDKQRSNPGIPEEKFAAEDHIRKQVSKCCSALTISGGWCSRNPNP